MTSSRGRWCECLWPNNQKQTSWGWPEGPMSSSGPCDHCPALWSSIGICHWIGRFATCTLCFSQMRAGSPWAHVTDVKGSGEAVENVMLPVTSFSMTGLVVGQWWSGEAYPWRERPLQARQWHPLGAIRYRDEILGPNVRPYAGAVGPGFLLVHDNAQPHVANWYHWMAPTLAWQ